MHTILREPSVPRITQAGFQVISIALEFAAGYAYERCLTILNKRTAFISSSQARIQPAAAVDSWLQLFRGSLADLPSTSTLKQLLTTPASAATPPSDMTRLATEIRNLLSHITENLPDACSPAIARAATWEGL